MGENNGLCDDERLLRIYKQSLSRIGQIWHQIGLSGEDGEAVAETLSERIQIALDEIVDEQENFQAGRKLGENLTSENVDAVKKAWKTRMDENINLGKQLIRGIKLEFSEMQNTWDSIGICNPRRMDRVKIVSQHGITLLEEMTREEKALKERLLQSIEKCTQDLATLSKELEIEPFAGPDGLTVLQLENELRTKFGDMVREKHRRLKKLKKLYDQNVALSSDLGTEPFYVRPSITPSLEFLSQLEEHTKTLLAEKENRLKDFYRMKSTIFDLFDELERIPSDKENEILGDEPLNLSLETMDGMRNLQQELEQSVKINKSKIIYLREELVKLWDRMQIGHVEREKFLDKCSGHRPSAIKAMRDEIEKLKLVQKQNVKKFVCKLREELEVLWEKCLYGREQKDMFRAFYDESFSEELLELHILEVEKLRSYQEENQDLIQKVQRWTHLWTQMLDFEKKASDPNRFNNRGGNLLQEEKQRKKLMKDLPKLEAELENLTEDWETKHGKAFRINGTRLIDYINDQWQSYRLGKETEKSERQKAKSKQIEEEALKGSKCVTPGMKRKMETPKSSVRKRLHETRTPHSSLAVYSTPHRRYHLRVKNRLVARRSRIQGSANKSSDKENGNLFNKTTITTNVEKNTEVSLASTVASYSDFSSALNNKAEQEACRSSTVMNKPPANSTNSPQKLQLLRSRGKLPLFI